MYEKSDTPEYIKMYWIKMYVYSNEINNNNNLLNK